MPFLPTQNHDKRSAMKAHKQQNPINEFSSTTTSADGQDSRFAVSGDPAVLRPKTSVAARSSEVSIGRQKDRKGQAARHGHSMNQDIPPFDVIAAAWIRLGDRDTA